MIKQFKFTICLLISLLMGISVFCSWPVPKNLCPATVNLRDTSKATTIVGTGTVASCNQAALSAALARGGIIKFNCSTTGQSVTITLTDTLEISPTNDTIIDGEGRVTLDGQRKVRILNFDRADFPQLTPILTVQRLRFINGFCQDDHGGCAILQKKGGTTIVNACTFENNIGPTVGQDTAGGAIWTIGGGTTTVNGCVFRSNKCSNGGAIGILGSGLAISNSHFEANEATGNGGNPGNGGNGGAISFDGRGRNNTICGTRFSKNQGNKFGGAFFRVSYAGTEQNIFDNVLADSNLIQKSGNGLAGAFYIQGGTVTVRSSTVFNNSAGGAGGFFLSNDKLVTFTNVNLLSNVAYTGLGAAMFCSNPVSGTFTGLTVANNYAGAFGAAFASCGTEISISNSIIANNTVGNPWPANACTSMMKAGVDVIQSPVNKQGPATGADAACADGQITRTNNITVILDLATWKIKMQGAQPKHVGPNVIPGL